MGLQFKRMFREEIYTTQVGTKKGTFYFHVAADCANDVIGYLESRIEYKRLSGVSRVDIYEGELFARYNGQKPVKSYSFITSI